MSILGLPINYSVFPSPHNPLFSLKLPAPYLVFSYLYTVWVVELDSFDDSSNVSPLGFYVSITQLRPKQVALKLSPRR